MITLGIIELVILERRFFFHRNIRVIEYLFSIIKWACCIAFMNIINFGNSQTSFRLLLL